ncbi:hypothetical protein [Micromonospora sp. WMMD1082]|uniref:hypothetical protein n=1 Tax=Micromonospora sp. WMMD1082 TaxID=3016104 RepID=UPI002417D66A|nr:hypothetical protein [Micromonospora sp. WMMD1082]MDG4797051.1 hypothetical protein [Micromonospora sp. WMMD1082]
MTGRVYRLSGGLVGFAVGDVYVLEGGPARVGFTRPGATDVLPQICELLDGNHCVPHIAQLLCVPVSEVTDWIALLVRHGLAHPVSAGAAVSAGTGPPTPAADFLSRTAGLGHPADVEQLLDNLCQGRALVAGRGWLPAAITAELDRSGVTMRPYHPDLLVGVPPATAGGRASALVVEVVNDGAPTALAATLRSGQWWLGARVDDRGGSVGPLLRPGLSCACQLPPPPRPDRSGPAATTVDLIATLVAGEVVHALTRGADLTTLDAILEIRCSDGAPVAIDRRLLRRRGCTDCGPNGTVDEGRHGGEYERENTIRPTPRHLPLRPSPLLPQPAHPLADPVRDAASG